MMVDRRKGKGLMAGSPSTPLSPTPRQARGRLSPLPASAGWGESEGGRHSRGPVYGPQDLCEAARSAVPFGTCATSKRDPGVGNAGLLSECPCGTWGDERPLDRLGAGSPPLVPRGARVREADAIRLCLRPGKQCFVIAVGRDETLMGRRGHVRRMAGARWIGGGEGLGCASSAFTGLRACFEITSGGPVRQGGSHGVNLAAVRGGWLRCSSVTDFLSNMRPRCASPSTPPRSQSLADLISKRALRKYVRTQFTWDSARVARSSPGNHLTGFQPARLMRDESARQAGRGIGS